MTEESKVPQESQPQPEVKEKEEVIEIPFDYKMFRPLMERAIKAIDNVKGTVEGCSAYEKYVDEMDNLLSSLKKIQSEVRQLHELDTVLASAKFTNKESVNTKIRKRVVEELTKHFKFYKLDEEEIDTGEDIVVLEETQATVEKTEKTPSRSLVGASNRERLRREARTEALQEMDLGSADFYERAFNQDNTLVNMDGVENVSTEGLTAEEISQFRASAATDSDPRIEELKAKALPKKLSSGPISHQGKNRSITRRS